MTGKTETSGQRELKASLHKCRRAFIAVGVASVLVNALYLTGSFYMLVVYDRVLASRSVATLIGISILALVLFAFQGVLDLIRARILARAGRTLSDDFSGRIYDTVCRLPLRTRMSSDGMQPLRDLDQVRSFLSGAGPIALLDMPWLPVYVVICFLFHPVIGVAALLGTVLLVTLAYMAERMTQPLAQALTGLAMKRNAMAEASRRNAEVMQAMGMAPWISRRWMAVNRDYLDGAQQTSDVGSGLGSASKIARMIIQSGVLGLGAYLVIKQEASGGIIIASSILVSRALAPVEAAIANWKGFIAARQSWGRVEQLLTLFPADREQLALPKPGESFAAEAVTVVPPGSQAAAAAEVTFTLNKGNALGIIGPSGGGKSCLLRVLAGVWPATRGTVSLDGASIGQWSSTALGKHIGYMPQDIEMFGGTIAANISRFDPDAKSEAIIAAAAAAGAHDMIVRMPKGYETEIGEGGTSISAGQRQRIGLARAMYGSPFLLLLDEPNSNLDPEGEEALTRAVLQCRQRGAIVILVAHRPSALAGVDLIMILNQGRMQAFGPREEVLGSLLRRPGAPAPTPGSTPTQPGLRVVTDPAGAASRAST